MADIGTSMDTDAVMQDMTDTNSVKEPLGLMSLPRELRMQIFSYVVIPVCSSSKCKQIDCTSLPRFIFRWSFCRPRSWTPWRPPNSINHHDFLCMAKVSTKPALVCRQINEEINHLLYRNHSFCARLSYLDDMADRLLPFVPLLVHVFLDMSLRMSDDRWPNAELLEQIHGGLTRSSKLRSFKLDIELMYDDRLRERWCGVWAHRTEQDDQVTAVLSDRDRELRRFGRAIGMLKDMKWKTTYHWRKLLKDA